MNLLAFVRAASRRTCGRLGCCRSWRRWAATCRPTSRRSALRTRSSLALAATTISRPTPQPSCSRFLTFRTVRPEIIVRECRRLAQQPGLSIHRAQSFSGLWRTRSKLPEWFLCDLIIADWQWSTTTRCVSGFSHLRWKELKCFPEFAVLHDWNV